MSSIATPPAERTMPLHHDIHVRRGDRDIRVTGTTAYTWHSSSLGPHAMEPDVHVEFRSRSGQFTAGLTLSEARDLALALTEAIAFAEHADDAAALAHPVCSHIGRPCDGCDPNCADYDPAELARKTEANNEVIGAVTGGVL